MEEAFCCTGTPETGWTTNGCGWTKGGSLREAQGFSNWGKHRVGEMKASFVFSYLTKG